MLPFTTPSGISMCGTTFGWPVPTCPSATADGRRWTPRPKKLPGGGTRYNNLLLTPSVVVLLFNQTQYHPLSDSVALHLWRQSRGAKFNTGSTPTSSFPWPTLTFAISLPTRNRHGDIQDQNWTPTSKSKSRTMAEAISIEYIRKIHALWSLRVWSLRASTGFLK